MPQENKMGYMPIPKLVITMSLPIIISMLVQALYNIVDSVFVSYYDPDALTAISLVFSVQNLMIGVATGTGVGVNALLSRALGQKNRERASKIGENGVFLALVGYAIFLLFAVFGAKPFMHMMTSDRSVYDYGVAYTQICCGLSFGVFEQIMFERLMQATGRTFYTMITQGMGAIINIVLDPLFIFDKVPVLGISGLGLGAAGAAWATVIGQIAAFILGAVINHFKNPDIRLSIKGFRPDIKMIGSIYAIGVPSIIMVAIGSIMTTCMNMILGVFGALRNIAINVFGAYFKLQSFVFMPIFGLNNGIIPIISFNFGAQKRRRMLSTVKCGMCVATFFMLLGLALMQFIPEVLLGIFNADADMIRIGTPALRIISIGFPLAGISIVLGSVFQSLGKSVMSMFVSFARQIVVLIPVAFVLSKIEPSLVWWAFPVAEAASLAVSIFCYGKVYRTTIKEIAE